jgi:hypothetical protein
VTSAYVVVGAVVACGGYFTADPGGRRDVPGVGDRRLCVSISRETIAGVDEALFALVKKLRTMTGCDALDLVRLSESELGAFTVRLEVRLVNRTNEPTLFLPPQSAEAIYELRTYEKRRVEG